MTQIYIDHYQPKPAPSASGKLRADAVVAISPIQVVKRPVIKPTFNGKRSLIILGNKTLQTAIPRPTHKVPKNKRKFIGNVRMVIPNTSKAKPITKVSSVDIFLAMLAVNGDKIAKAIKGKLIIKATFQFSNCKSSRMSPITGPTDVIAGLKLKATRIILIINKIV